MISKLILGTAQLGLNYGINNISGKVLIEESNKILKNAFDSGIRTLDTAEAYGDAHNLIGDFHKNNEYLRFKVITKFPKEVKLKSIKNKVFRYLAVLGVNCIDVLMFHSFESFKSNKKSIDFLLDLKSKGYLNHIGVSVYANDDLENLLYEDAISVIQLPFNLLDNISARGKLISKLKNNGKIIHTRSAFLQGLFFKSINDSNVIVQNLLSELEILNKVKNKLNCSIEELALSYCIQQKNIDNVIIGVDSSSQLKANIKASNYTIENSVLSLIDNIKVQNLNLLNPSLW